MQAHIEIGAKYTLVSRDRATSFTIREEVVVTGLLEGYNKYIGKLKNRAQGNIRLFSLEQDRRREYLVFSGHDLPFVLDSEMEHLPDRSGFHFFSDNPEKLKALLKADCLNFSADKAVQIRYSPTQDNGWILPPAYALFVPNT